MAPLNEFVKVIPNLFWNETVYKQTNQQTEENHHYHGKNVSSGGRAVIILLQALNFFLLDLSNWFPTVPAAPSLARINAPFPQLSDLSSTKADWFGSFPCFKFSMKSHLPSGWSSGLQRRSHLLPVCLCKPCLPKTSPISTDTWLSSNRVRLTVPQMHSSGFSCGSCTCLSCCSQCVPVTNFYSSRTLPRCFYHPGKLLQLFPCHVGYVWCLLCVLRASWGYSDVTPTSYVPVRKNTETCL